MTVTTDSETCPDATALGEFLLGKRSDQEIAAIAKHLESCAKCAEKAQSLESRTDVLIESLRQSLDEEAYGEEAACREGSNAIAGRQFSVVAARPLEVAAPNEQKSLSQPLGRLGTYELLEEIGRGGTGVVYRAEHTRLKTIVAVKVLPTEALTRPDTLVRFDRELEAIGGLDHRHIVQATDAGEDEGRHFLVMEYIAAADLATLVGKQGPLPPAEATSCVLQAAHGLAFAHDQGMIHRDVKPSNLLLGANGIVKISDFGLARILQKVEEDGSTHTGSLLGTFDYMAPEQALNVKAADERADIYGLGCTLYFLLTGRPPYRCESVFETLIAHREQPVPSVRQIRSEVPRPLDRLLHRMLSKDPRHRPSSMKQIIEALNALRSSSIVEEQDDLACLYTDEQRQVEINSPSPSRRWIAGNRHFPSWVAATTGALVMAMVIAVGSLIWSGKSPDSQLPLNFSAARYDVRLVQANEGEMLQHISEAVQLLEGVLPHQKAYTGRFRFLDFIDPISNSGGYFDADLAFPGSSFGGTAKNRNHFALKAVAAVDFPRGGVWTFCVISDDGFRLSIDGKMVGQHESSRTQAASFIPVEIDRPRSHVVELIYFEGIGGADLELSAAEGRFSDFDAKAFHLVGDSYEGGLPLVRQ